MKALGEFNCRHAAAGAFALSADVVEARADSVAEIDRLLARMPTWAQAYVEIPLGPDPAPLIAAIARHGARAKMRTAASPPRPFRAQSISYGSSARAPPPASRSRPPPACTTPSAPSTASPTRPTAPAAPCSGFSLSSWPRPWLRQGLGDAEAELLLEERSASAISLSAEAIDWRGHRLSQAAVEEARAAAIQAFGSCSFTEPVGELRGMGMLGAG